MSGSRYGLEDGDNKHFWNFIKILADCTAQHPRKQPNVSLPHSTRCYWNTWQKFTDLSWAQKRRKFLCNRKRFDASFWSYGPFYVGGGRWVSSRPLESVCLQLVDSNSTVLTTTNYRQPSKCSCASINSAAHLITDCGTHWKVPGVSLINSPPSSTSCCSSVTPFTAFACTVHLRRTHA
jgi:hypothetical protein